MIETQQHRQPWRDGKNGQLERTIKKLSQFDNEKPDELESEFDHFDAANSYPTSPFTCTSLYGFTSKER